MFGHSREGVAKEHIAVIGCGLAFAVLFSVIRAAYLRASVVRQVTAFCDELSAKDRTRWAGKRILAIVNPHGRTVADRRRWVRFMRSLSRCARLSVCGWSSGKPSPPAMRLA